MTREVVVQSEVCDEEHVAEVRRIWAGITKPEREGGLCIRVQL